jgi:hypothetical protein
MQQVPVEMLGYRSALVMDFERDGEAAQALQVSHSLQRDS